ncbi:VWA domain-containing protein [candidate division KSB1 bacterium]|nr:VWA domain-containing protein [candidate division KSB1 bacterium]
MKHTLILIIMSLVIYVQAGATTDPVHEQQHDNYSLNSPSRHSYKAEYDIESVTSASALNKTNGIGPAGEQMTTNISEMTLVQGGHFTIGTNNGVSASSLDDKCGITFGHPYAMTSYPLLAIDGQWKKPASVFDIFQAAPVSTPSGLTLTYEQANLCRMTFSITPEQSGRVITLSMNLENLDAVPHTFAAGLVFDAGLGKRGDGWPEVKSQPVWNDTALTSPTSLALIERIGLHDGLNVTLDFAAMSPQKVIVDNWQSIYADDSPMFSNSYLRKLYDTALKIIGTEQTIADGGALTQSISVTIEQPDFGNVFTRWDLPGFLSIENNLLFPRTLPTVIEITNVSNSTYNNCTMNLTYPPELSGTPTSVSFNLAAQGTQYRNATLQSKEILKDKIVELSFDIRRNGEILDTMYRQVFIPAIPLSDTGLVCTIDSVITSLYPSVSLLFEAQVEKTGQRLFDLTSENIFLYENEIRVRNFEFGKDTTGGVSQADVVFVLDCSGSMGDDIQAVRSHINEFADSLVAQGIDLRVGGVAFSDYFDNVYDMTSNLEGFRNWLNSIKLYGGRENSLGALWQATELSLRPNSKRTFVWITDEDYPVKPEINLTVQDVVNRLLEYEVTVHSICLPSLQTKWCNPVIEPTGGKFFDIAGNFRDIMLEISRMKGSNKFMISYTSPNTTVGTNSVMLELHYAGLGGFGYTEYNIGGRVSALTRPLTCYPNPFNPTIQIVTDLGELSHGELSIYNILGQRVKSFPLNGMQQRHTVQWNARDTFGRQVAAGTYFVRLQAVDAYGGQRYSPIQKILYLK